MGWPTAFHSKAFWLIYTGHFFPAYFSVRGVSQAQMHVHSIVRAAASFPDCEHRTAGLDCDVNILLHI